MKKAFAILVVMLFLSAPSQAIEFGGYKNPLSALIEWYSSTPQEEEVEEEDYESDATLFGFLLAVTYYTATMEINSSH